MNRTESVSQSISGSNLSGSMSSSVTSTYAYSGAKRLDSKIEYV